MRNATLLGARICPVCTFPTRCFHAWDGRGNAWYYCASPHCGRRTIGPSPLAGGRRAEGNAGLRRLAAAVLEIEPPQLRAAPRHQAPRLSAADIDKLCEYSRRRIKDLAKREGTVLVRTAIKNHLRPKVRTAAVLERVLARLIATGFLERAETQRTDRRGRPAEYYRIVGARA